MTSREDLLNYLYQQKVIWTARRDDAGPDTTREDARLAQINASIVRAKALPDGPLMRRAVRLEPLRDGGQKDGVR